MKRSARKIAALIEKARDTELQNGIPADAIVNQLPARALPPATGSSRGGVVLSDSTPADVDTTGAAGSSADASRADHVHAITTTVDHNHTAAGGDGGKLTNDVHDGYSVYEETSAPSSPAANTARLYARDKSGVTELFYKNDAGTERDLSTAGGGGGGDSTYTAAYGSRPAASNDGDLFLPSDGAVIERDTGSVWVPWGPIWPLVAPPTSSWSWDNQGGASVDTTKGGLRFDVPANGSGAVHIYYRTAPSAPYTITALILPAPLIMTNSSQGVGLCFRESSSGKLHNFHIQDNATNVNPFIISDKWNSSSSFSGNYTVLDFQLSGAALWMRIKDDNTNRICELSNDGQTWVQIHSVGRTDFLTADQVGIYLREGATYATGGWVLSWG